MLKAVCNICHRDVKQLLTNPAHFCDRCLPHAEKFITEQAAAWGEAEAEKQRKMESFRNRFMRENVMRLEAVK
jgi:hypothetical protein